MIFLISFAFYSFEMSTFSLSANISMKTRDNLIIYKTLFDTLPIENTYTELERLKFLIRRRESFESVKFSFGSTVS